MGSEWTVMLSRLQAMHSDAMLNKFDGDGEIIDECEKAADAIGDAVVAVRDALRALRAIS